MKKSGLQDMKKQNRRVLLQTVLEHESLSRIEIANLTELSPSTVSGLVSELLEEGLLVESGVRVATGGRSRTALTVNRDRGVVAVAGNRPKKQPPDPVRPGTSGETERCSGRTVSCPATNCLPR